MLKDFLDTAPWQALKFYEPGNYIGFGANRPAIDSVARYFYGRGLADRYA